MSLLALGINHTTAPVETRERVAFGPERLGVALHSLTQHRPGAEVAILSTCNRTELYCALPEEDPRSIIRWLSEFHRIRIEDLDPYLYTHPDQGAVRHMLRVASGLDSMILGEPQILGQMKEAYQAAREAGTLGPQLRRLFQHTFTVAKQVRTDTAIGSSPVSVAFAAVSLARQIFGDLASQTALLIGAGDTIELAARHLHEQGIKRMIIANRTVERAHLLAQEFGGYAIALSEIGLHLAEADIVVSSTASPAPILLRETVEKALKARKHRPVLMVDIAVPRDIEASIAELEDVYLYTVDDLQEVIDENMKSRRAAAKQAEEIIDLQTAHFMGWLRSLNAVDTIRAVRERADQTRAEVLARAEAMIAAGRDPAEVAQWLAHTLTNKLIHAPSAQLRQAAFEGRREVLDAARELFQLKK